MAREKDADTSIDPRDLPELAQADWDGLSEPADPEDLDVTELGDEIDLDEEDDLLEEDDDNPYQESDEALPDDEEEPALSRNPGGR